MESDLKIALYIGDHKEDSWDVRLGWFMTRLVQWVSLILRFKPTTYAKVTHTECILAEHPDGSVDIASASIRDGFCVRTKKNVFLVPGNWIIRDKPEWDVERARDWFIEHDGELYDWRGAAVCWLPVLWSMAKRWFCNQACGEAVGVKNPRSMPAEFAETVMS